MSRSGNFVDETPFLLGICRRGWGVRARWALLLPRARDSESPRVLSTRKGRDLPSRSDQAESVATWKSPQVKSVHAGEPLFNAIRNWRNGFLCQ